MARIVGIDLPKDKRLIALTYIYGIGPYLSNKIIELSLDPSKRVKNLDESEIVRIRELVREYTTEGELRRKHMDDFRRLDQIRCYRGRRHKLRLPSRGQRSHTNARTRRGKKIAVAGKKKAV